MLKVTLVGLASCALVTSGMAQADTFNPGPTSPDADYVGSFAVTTDTDEQRLVRAARYVDRVCEGRRLRDRRECARVWRIMNTALAEARAKPAAAQP